MFMLIHPLPSLDNKKKMLTTTTLEMMTMATKMPLMMMHLTVAWSFFFYVIAYIRKREKIEEETGFYTIASLVILMPFLMIDLLPVTFNFLKFHGKTTCEKLHFNYLFPNNKEFPVLIYT